MYYLSILGPFPLILWFDVIAEGAGENMVSIGRYCSLAQNITIMLDGNHCYKRISSYDWRLRGKNSFKSDEYAVREKLHVPPCEQNYVKSVKIGNDVWIGFDVMIFGGVTVGDGAVIGSKAVVRTNVEPYRYGDKHGLLSLPSLPLLLLLALLLPLLFSCSMFNASITFVFKALCTEILRNI